MSEKETEVKIMKRERDEEREQKIDLLADNKILKVSL